MTVQPILIAVLLDRSGSMYELRSDTIGSFNQLLEEQKREAGKALFMLNAFSDTCENAIPPTDIAEVSPLTEATYHIGGNTALFDSIVGTVTDIEMFIEQQGPHQVFLIILTDGKENASKEMAEKSIVGRILDDVQTKKHWQVRFLSTDWEAVEEARGLNVHHSVHIHPGEMRDSISMTSQDLSSIRRKRGGSGPDSSGGGQVH